MAESAYEFICSVLAQRCGTPAERLREDARFIEDIGLSSLDVVVLLSDAEDELGITVPDESILSMKTLAGAATVIASLAGMPSGVAEHNGDESGGEGDGDDGGNESGDAASDGD